jgi:hypothetical protein
MPSNLIRSPALNRWRRHGKSHQKSQNQDARAHKLCDEQSDSLMLPSPLHPPSRKRLAGGRQNRKQNNNYYGQDDVWQKAMDSLMTRAAYTRQ